MPSTELEMKALLDARSKAVGAKDIERLMSFYAPDIVYFDIVPPLRYVGSAALRDRFLDWFGRYESAIGQEIGGLNVSASGDVAIASMLIRASGTLKTGREVAFWVRATTSCRRSDQRWLITHEHVSLPADLQSGRTVMDLSP